MATTIRYRRMVTTSEGTVKQGLVANKHSTLVSVVMLVLVVCLLSSIMSKPTTTVKYPVLLFQQSDTVIFVRQPYLSQCYLLSLTWWLILIDYLYHFTKLSKHYSE
jgi:hypothetical protein